MGEGFWLGAVIVVLLGVVTLGAYSQVKEKQRWDAYAAEHCTVIGKIAPSSSSAVGVGVGGSGGGTVTVTPVYIPGKTGYRCDDGMEYWR